MITTDLKKGLLNIRMLGVILVSIGLFGFELIVNQGFFKFRFWEYKQTDIVTFYCTIFALSVYILVVGMFPGMPYAFSLHEERSNGYMKYIITRQGIKKYINKKVIVTAVTGAFTTLIPFLFLLIPTFIAGSKTTEVNHMEVLEMMCWGKVMYIWDGKLLICLKGALLMSFGVMWALLSLLLSMFVKNKYFAFLFPYIIYELLFYMGSSVGLISVMNPPDLIRFDVDAKYSVTMPFILFGIYIVILILLIKIVFKRQIKNGKC